MVLFYSSLDPSLMGTAFLIGGNPSFHSGQSVSSRCHQILVRFCFLCTDIGKVQDKTLGKLTPQLMRIRLGKDLPTIMSPYLLRVIPTLISCLLVRKPRFSSSHDLSGCTWSSLRISSRGRDRTVERITNPYSSPVQDSKL